MKPFLYVMLAMAIQVNLVSASPGDSISIIPQPQEMEIREGNFTLNDKTVIVCNLRNPQLRHIAESLVQEVSRLTGLPSLKIRHRNTDGGNNAIMLELWNEADGLGEEGYILETGPGEAVIRSVSPHGLFYGIQTFCQLLPVRQTTTGRISIPAVKILDKPRYKWRGLMLDVGRYFFPVDFIKSLLDNMARHKFNTFHWHLTEDHGWRMEVKRFPELNEKGAFRAGTQFNHGTKNVVDMSPHWGYYTQSQIKEVVRYAAERYITVVPEIEMPGHSLSALVAYPELSCTGGPFTIPVSWGIQKDIYCAGNEQTFEFLEKVLSEVTELFPGPIIHIGGDEAPKDRWKVCEKCQRRIRDIGLKDEDELQSYFIKRISAFLKSKGKRLIGWDEIMAGGLASNAMVMSWRGTEGGIKAASSRHDVVMSPNTYLYFDYYQGNQEHEPIGYKGMTTLKKVYDYEPTPAELDTEYRKYITGVQANIWAEYIHTPEKAEYMTFPRASALAEVAWTNPENKSWEKFMKKMNAQYQRYDKWGILYARSAFQVEVVADIDSVSHRASITLETQVCPAEIRYTIDGSAPERTSLLYTTPFEIKTPSIIRTATFRNGKQLSPVTMKTVALPPRLSK